MNGRYFVDCREQWPKPWAQDDAAAVRPWQVTEQLTAESAGSEEVDS